MKPKINVLNLLLLTIACIGVPILYIHQVVNHFNPFHLNGKQFLSFFILQSTASITVATGWLIVLYKKVSVNSAYILKGTFPQPVHYTILVIMVGIFRLVQGLCNQKPIGFLVMLLFTDAVAYLIIRFYTNEIRKRECGGFTPGKQ